MGLHILKRITSMVPVLFMISVLSFSVIQLPPGDFVDEYVQDQRNKGVKISQVTEQVWRDRYGVDDPVIEQYVDWIGNVVQGDLGVSLYRKQNVSKIILDRLPFTVAIGVMSWFLLHAIALPIGMISATRQYSITDYFFQFVGFVAMGIPEFIMAIVIMWSMFKVTGNVTVGALSPEYVGAPLSFGKLIDMASHLWVPALIAAGGGTAGTIRILRANLLDEIGKPYVIVARSKGLSKRRVIYKYPLRVALNPFVVGTASILPALISGELIISITLGIPTLAPVFLEALEMQDMQLAGSIVLVLSTLTVVGILLADILLAIVDPRIRGSV
jgi:peptide/nickel transport system permease protein